MHVASLLSLGTMVLYSSAGRGGAEHASGGAERRGGASGEAERSMRAASASGEAERSMRTCEAERSRNSTSTPQGCKFVQQAR
jgi:hypothetical protein